MNTNRTFAQVILTLIVASSPLFSMVSAQAAETDAKKSTSETQKKAPSKKNNNLEEAAIKLESVFVGDKEQPAISYFIPWQGISTPDKLHWNVEQKHDNALDLVNRDVLLRSIHIYEEMQLENP